MTFLSECSEVEVKINVKCKLKPHNRPLSLTVVSGFVVCCTVCPSCVPVHPCVSLHPCSASASLVLPCSHCSPALSSFPVPLFLSPELLCPSLHLHLIPTSSSRWSSFQSTAQFACPLVLFLLFSIKSSAFDLVRQLSPAFWSTCSTLFVTQSKICKNGIS